jgi:trigger factor
MSTVTRENIGLLNDKLTVTVKKEDYFPSFEKALKQYAKVANIPGFRKGMVPTGMVKKMHGPSVFTDEVLKSVEKGLVDYLGQQKLDIFAQPLPASANDARNLDMNNPSDYSISFEIGLKPDFQLPDLSSAKLTRYKIEVTDEMVNDEVKRLQQRMGKLGEPEAVTTDENVLNIKFEESDEKGNIVEGAEGKENSVLVKYFSEATRPGLMGLKKDDSLVIQLKSAFDDKEREWILDDLKLEKNDPANAEKYFKLTITKVGLIEPRELNAEFFKEVYPAKEIASEDELKKEIRSEIEKYWESQSRNHLHHELYHLLAEHTSMEFPESFLKKWIGTSGEKQKSTDEVEQEFPTFKNQLKWTLVSDKIIRENALEVNPEEMREFMRQQVMGYFGSMNLGEDTSWLDSYVERMLKDEQQVESAYRRLVTEKIFNWSETKITPTEKSISVEDFGKLQKEHDHEH